MIKAAITALALTSLLGLSPPLPAQAGWRRTSDLNFNTAFTLERGMVEIGVMAPLSVGVTDEVQLAIHPILLLLGQPYLALRWRVTRYDDVTVALNLGGSWSFIRREDASGDPAPDLEEARLGFPGTVQLGATVTFKLGKRWLLSMGGGPALDFLGERPIRGLAELHGSVHWLIDRDQLLMLQGSTYLDGSDALKIRRPLAELIFAVALSDMIHLGVGLGVGRFVFEPNATTRDELDLFPVIDIWFRL